MGSKLYNSFAFRNILVLGPQCLCGDLFLYCTIWTITQRSWGHLFPIPHSTTTNIILVSTTLYQIISLSLAKLCHLEFMITASIIQAGTLNWISHNLLQSWVPYGNWIQPYHPYWTPFMESIKTDSDPINCFLTFALLLQNLYDDSLGIYLYIHQ